MGILEAKGLWKAFGSLVVAADVHLVLREGETLGLIGPNGAGKTTLFNLLTGVIRPDRGQVLFQGEEITHLSPRERARKGLGRTFQVPKPFVNLSVLENVVVAAVFGAGEPVSRAEARAREILAQTGLLDKGPWPAGKLPLLDRKRLELARALALRPRVLLLDEIAGGLTEREVERLLEVLARLKSEGLSLLWSEHVLHALLGLADRVLALAFGQVIAEGRPEEVLHHPQVREVYLGMEV